jgi:hypothetical protein
MSRLYVIGIGRAMAAGYRTHMTRTLLLLILAGTTRLFAQDAPKTGDQIIRAMHDRYAKTWYHTLTFSQRTIMHPKPDTTVTEIWNEAALFPGRLRIDLLRNADTIEAMYVGDSLFIWHHDSVRARRKSRNIFMIMGFDVYTQPVEQTLAVLASEHYAMAPVREDTWMGHPVYVIGAGAGDLHSNQLWIEKNRLLFVRAIQPDLRDTSKVGDYRFENYVRVPGGWLSETVETFFNGRLTQREEYFNVKTNPNVEPGLFTPPHG